VEFNACQTRFFYPKNAPQAQLVKESALQARFVRLNPDEYSVLLM